MRADKRYKQMPSFDERQLHSTFYIEICFCLFDVLLFQGGAERIVHMKSPISTKMLAESTENQINGVHCSLISLWIE